MPGRVPRMPNVEVLVTVNRSCVASFTFTIYDFLLTLFDEIEIIWPKPSRSWVKWKFLFLRYFALATQLMNIVVDLRIMSPADDKSRSTVIYGFLIAQLVACFFLSVVVELILMMRVYALYNKNLYVALVCGSLLTAQIATTSVGIAWKVEKRHAINEIDWEALSGSFPYFSVSTLISQSVIVILTIVNHCKATKAGMTSGVLNLLLRDGILAFIAFTFITCIIVVSVINSSAYAIMSYFWLVSITSCLGYRLVINLERYWKPEQDLVESAPTLTELSSAFFGSELNESMSRIIMPTASQLREPP